MSKLYYVAVPVVKLWFSSVSRLHVVGQENVPKNGPLIVAANHLSLVDPPLIGGFFPRRIVFMAKDELFSFPSGLLIRALGAFPARKTKVSVEALRRALGVLDDGQVLGIFPEGKRSFDCEMQKAELGVAFIAHRSGVPIVPVGISGSEAFEYSGAMFKRPKVTVAIGQPFSFSKSEGRLTREQLTHTADVIMERIGDLLPREYRGVYGKVGDIQGDIGVVSGSKVGI